MNYEDMHIKVDTVDEAHFKVSVFCYERARILHSIDLIATCLPY